MKLTPEELALAKQQLERMRNERRYTPEEIALMQKYPRHTLEAAKYIDSCDCGETSIGKGHEDSFWKLRMQETHNLRPGHDT
jgi:hypothetical protein